MDHSFEGNSGGIANVQYPSNLEGWSITPNRSPCNVSYMQYVIFYVKHFNYELQVLCIIIYSLKFKQEQVDYGRPDLPRDYPPRVKFTLKPSESAKQCTFWLKVTGMTEPFQFQFLLDHPKSKF